MVTVLLCLQRQSSLLRDRKGSNLKWTSDPDSNGTCFAVLTACLIPRIYIHVALIPSSYPLAYIEMP